LAVAFLDRAARFVNGEDTFAGRDGRRRGCSELPFI